MSYLLFVPGVVRLVQAGKHFQQWLMQQSLILYLPPEVEQQIRVIRQRPSYCVYNAPYAACELIPLPDSPIVRQQSRNNDFYMHLFDINSSKDIKIRFSVTRPTFFGIFMLKGECRFNDEKGNQVSRALEKTFYFCHNGIATYDAWFKKGLNTILVVAYRAEWVNAELNNLPEFAKLIKNLIAGSKEPVILPPCHLGQMVERYLARIIYYTAPSSTERGSGIFHLLVKCMMFYHGELERGHHLPAHDEQLDEERLRDFLNRYYTTEKVMKRDTIAAELGLSEWTVKQLFAKLFGKPVRQHIIDKRMSRAAELLLETEMRIGEIALAVGYDNVTYFSKAFLHYYHTTPRAYRKVKNG